MHPAPSVIVFTTFSGLGFGLLAWLGFGYPAVTGWTAFVFFAIAFGMAGGGLLASTFHLGRRAAGGEAVALVAVDGDKVASGKDFDDRGRVSAKAVAIDEARARALPGSPGTRRSRG